MSAPSPAHQRHRLARLVLGLCLGASLSCASQRPETRKQLAAWESDLDDLRQQNLQLLERVSALELQRQSVARPEDARPSPPSRVLPIVRLEPGSHGQTVESSAEPVAPEGPAPAAPSDTSSAPGGTAALDLDRPVIRVEGNVVLEGGAVPARER